VLYASTTAAEDEQTSLTLEALAGALDRTPLPNALRIDVQLVAAELMNNVVEHAYRNRPKGQVVLQVLLSDLAVKIVVKDRGNPFPVGLLASPRDAGEPEAAGHPPNRDASRSPGENSFGSNRPARPPDAPEDAERGAETAGPAVRGGPDRVGVGGQGLTSDLGAAGAEPQGGDDARPPDGLSPPESADARMCIEEGGYGYGLIRACSSHLAYRRTDGENTFVMSVGRR
jgi:hypothetical protein